MHDPCFVPGYECLTKCFFLFLCLRICSLGEIGHCESGIRIALELFLQDSNTIFLQLRYFSSGQKDIIPAVTHTITIMAFPCHWAYPGSLGGIGDIDDSPSLSLLQVLYLCKQPASNREAIGPPNMDSNSDLGPHS